MEGEDIGSGEYIVEGLVLNAGLLEFGDGLHIVGADLAAEAEEDVANGLADFAGADDADGFAAEIEAHEAIEGKIGTPGTIVGAMDAAVEGEHEADGEFGHAVGGIGRYACDADALRGGGLEVDIVVAGGADDDKADAMPGQRTQDRFIDLIVDKDADGVLSLGEANRLGG